jgi:hypothetical protein
MATQLKPDVLEALRAWNAGKPVKSIELGHVHRMKDVPGFSATIDASKHLHQDQERAHAYCFYLIELFKTNGVPAEHEDFLKACDEYETLFREEEDGNEQLTPEEIAGAESLAWKALRFGWARSIEGHKDSMYITVSRK